ncbi:hypothetical protein ABIA38_005886 [Embleya sp. AB8]
MPRVFSGERDTTDPSPRLLTAGHPGTATNEPSLPQT